MKGGGITICKHAKQRVPHKAGLVGGHSECGGAERDRRGEQERRVRERGQEKEQCFQCCPNRLCLMGVSVL